MTDVGLTYGRGVAFGVGLSPAGQVSFSAGPANIAESLRIILATEPGGRVTPEHRAMTRELLLERTFANRFTDRKHAIAVYERHNREVVDSLPAERLLVYETGAGWEPLCAFLECAIPVEPYPLTNTTEEFRARRKS